jgi:ADP-ribose pyrophosphatase YjhB (NUDIX family)
MSDKALVGLGVIILNNEGKVLIGKRKGFVPKYSIPGGNLEPGETFEAGSMREIKEETNLDVKEVTVIGVTNNLETFKETGKHYISIVSLVTDFSGDPQLMEPEKCEEWIWCDPKDLPQPHFDASSLAIDLYLQNKFYIP